MLVPPPTHLDLIVADNNYVVQEIRPFKGGHKTDNIL